VTPIGISSQTICASIFQKRKTCTRLANLYKNRNWLSVIEQAKYQNRKHF